MFRAPFTKVLLRDNFAANILCSFSKVLAGVLYCGCYFGTGAFLYTADPNDDTGSEKFHTCATSSAITGLTVLCFCIPLCIRLFQCMRLLYEYKVSPWTQPQHNTTVDYSQQTSLDPTEDPATEWGHTWLSPMMHEFENMNQSNGSSDSSGGCSNKGGVVLHGASASAVSLTELNAEVHNMGESRNAPSSIEMIHLPTPAQASSMNSNVTDPSSITTTTTTATTGIATATIEPDQINDTGLRARPRGWSSVPSLLYDVSSITVDTNEDPDVHTYKCNSTHGNTHHGTHTHAHTSNIVSHSPNLSTVKRDRIRYGHALASGKSNITNSTTPVPTNNNDMHTNKASKNSGYTKHNVEWGNTFFNPLVGLHATHVDDTDHSSSSHEHPSDESHTSNLDSSHFSHAYHSSNSSMSHSYRSAHSLQTIVRKVCATPIKLLTPYYHTLRSCTDPWYARFKTVWIWPHAPNAFQYVLQIMVVLIGAYPPQDPDSAAYIACFRCLSR